MVRIGGLQVRIYVPLGRHEGVIHYDFPYSGIAFRVIPYPSNKNPFTLHRSAKASNPNQSKPPALTGYLSQATRVPKKPTPPILGPPVES